MMKVEQLFEKTHQMPTVPKVVQELIDSFNDDDIDIHAVARKVAVDQVLTAKVLRLANSSYYGVSRQIGSVDEAIVVMGFNSLRTLVVATGVTGAFAPIEGFDRQRFWKRALVVAAYAKWVAKQAKQAQELAFTAGLMHEIGVVLMYLTVPKEAAHIDEVVSQGAVRVKVEAAEFGFANNEVGAELARRWNFPEAIQQAIRHYAAPLAAEPFSVLAAIIHVAIWLARSQEQAEVAGPCPMDIVATLGLDEEVLTRAPALEEVSSGLDAFLS